jgi:hypothetical protein
MTSYVESEAFRPRLVCWLPVVDEVRTRIYGLKMDNMIPATSIVAKNLDIQLDAIEIR